MFHAASQSYSQWGCFQKRKTKMQNKIGQNLVTSIMGCYVQRTCTTNISLSISGIVLYKEFYGLTFLEIFMFLFG